MHRGVFPGQDGSAVAQDENEHRASLNHSCFLFKGIPAMKTLFATLAFVALMAWGTACQAGVVGVAADDGDGAVVCTGTWTATPGWTPESETDAGTMAIVGDQYWGPGHIGTEGLDDAAHFTVDGIRPSSCGRRSITTRASLGRVYLVNIYMDQPFTVSMPTVYTPDTSEPGWTVGSYDATATLVSGHYKASVNYVGGTPIPDWGRWTSATS